MTLLPAGALAQPVRTAAVKTSASAGIFIVVIPAQAGIQWKMLHSDAITCLDGNWLKPEKVPGNTDGLDSRLGFGILRRSTSCVPAVVRGNDE
jgi:hypothetical protein